MDNATALRSTIAPPASSSIADTLVFARDLTKYGFLPEAIDTLNVLVHSGSASPGTFHYLGDALRDQGALGDALAAYDAAMARLMTPPSVTLLVARARTLRLLGRLQPACDAYQTAIQTRELNGGHAYGEEVYLELAKTQELLGNEEQAENAFGRWMENAYLADHAGKTLYCWIPKNACTFFKTAMVLNSPYADTFHASKQDAHVFTRQPKSGFHLDDRSYLQDCRFFRFAILRNPFERLASAFANLFVLPVRRQRIAIDGVREVTLGVYRRKELPPDFARSISFEEFIRYIVETDDIDLNYHWRPQRTFFSTGLKDFEFVGRFEAVDDIMCELISRRQWRFEGIKDLNRTEYAKADTRLPYHTMPPHALAALSGFPPAASLFTPELRALVAERFADDFHLYSEQFGIDLREPPPRQTTLGTVGGAKEGVAEATAAFPTAPEDPTATERGRDGCSIPVATGADLPDVGFDQVLQVSAEIPNDLEQKLVLAFHEQTEGRSTRVILAPGVYRVSIFVPWARETSGVVLIEAEHSGTAILSGADPFCGWQLERGLWCAEWPYRWGTAPAPPDFGNPYLKTPELMLRREIVIVDGVLMCQSLNPSGLSPGSFCVDEDSGKIFLNPMAGVDPGSAMVEVATRSVAIHLAGRANVIIRGLVFRHDGSFHAAPQCAPLLISSCRNILVEECQFIENNNKGLYFGGAHNTNITIRGSRFMRNGCIGLNAAQCNNLLIENCETSLNNWRGAWAGVYRRWPSGFKVTRSRRVTMRFHRSVCNSATGGWFDLENRDVRIESSMFYGNYRGLHLEAGIGPFMVSHCQITANRQEPVMNEWRWAFGSGIVLSHAPDVILLENLICDNDLAQVGVRDDREKYVVLDATSGTRHEWHTERLTLRGNTIIGSAFPSSLLHLPSRNFDDGRFWEDFRASGNVYIGRPGDKLFLVGGFKPCPDGPAESVPVPQKLDFEQWTQHSGQDFGSTYNHAHPLFSR